MTSQSQPCGDAKSAATEAPPSAALKPSEVLAKAADLIEPEGAWTQGAFARSKPSRRQPRSRWPRKRSCYCALGAISEVIGGAPDDVHPWSHEATMYLEGAAGVACGIPGWNDESWRTQAEVVAALRKAADLARSQDQ